jgi:hypothetical protein
MKTSKYTELRNNPPVLNVVPNAREIVIDLVSCMCDNKNKLSFKRDANGDYKISTHGYAFSNFQIKHDKIDIEWEADAQNWESVFKMINTGTSLIESVRSR